MHELLASGVEVASVTAAERKLPNVIEVPRPEQPRKQRDPELKGPDPALGEVSFTDAMAAFHATGQVRTVPAGGGRV